MAQCIKYYKLLQSGSYLDLGFPGGTPVWGPPTSTTTFGCPVARQFGDLRLQLRPWVARWRVSLGTSHFNYDLGLPGGASVWGPPTSTTPLGCPVARQFGDLTLQLRLWVAKWHVSLGTSHFN